MSNATTKAKEIIELVNQDEPIDSIKARTSSADDEWYRFSSKAYSLSLEETKKRRKGI